MSSRSDLIWCEKTVLKITRQKKSLALLHHSIRSNFCFFFFFFLEYFQVEETPKIKVTFPHFLLAMLCYATYCFASFFHHSSILAYYIHTSSFLIEPSFFWPWQKDFVLQSSSSSVKPIFVFWFMSHKDNKTKCSYFLLLYSYEMRFYKLLL